MNDPDFATRICLIARIARGTGAADRITLMEQAGLFEDANRLDDAAIRRVTESDPTLIKDWLEWSATKRYNGPAFMGASDDLQLACSQCSMFIVAELGTFKELRKKRTR